MTMHLKSALLLLSLAFFTNCSQEKRVIKSVYETGRDKVVFLYPDRNDVSFYKQQGFYSNGHLEYEGFYKNGQKTGHWKSWSVSGHQTADWTILDGKENGHIRCWYDDGTKKREGFLKRGIKNGFTREWYDNGKPASAGDYSNGQKAGSWTTWDKNGTWKILEYKNDTLWGRTIEHLIDSTTVTLVAGQYEAGEENGIWKWFDKDSIIYESSTYHNGKLNGENIEYHKNGKIKSKGYLVNGKYNGTVYHFTHTEILDKVEQYKNGKLITEN